MINLCRSAKKKKKINLCSKKTVTLSQLQGKFLLVHKKPMNLYHIEYPFLVIISMLIEIDYGLLLPIISVHIANQLPH